MIALIGWGGAQLYAQVSAHAAIVGSYQTTSTSSTVVAKPTSR
jgi:hypothetical protein